MSKLTDKDIFFIITTYETLIKCRFDQLQQRSSSDVGGAYVYESEGKEFLEFASDAIELLEKLEPSTASVKSTLKGLIEFLKGFRFEPLEELSFLENN